MIKNINACLSSKSDNWKTPTNLYDFFKKEGFIDTFPYMSEYNEFDRNYYNCKLFINPPFSKLDQVSEWIIKQLKNRNMVVLLIPARTDTRYFHMLLDTFNFTVYFIKGRLHFNDSKSAPFPTLFLVYDNRSSNYNLQFYIHCDLESFMNRVRKYK